MEQILFVVGIGIVGVLLIIGAILLLNKEDSPEERDKKIKKQIINEMLASAENDEEKARILAMAKNDADDEAIQDNSTSKNNLYGIDAHNGDILDKMIASQLSEDNSTQNLNILSGVDGFNETTGNENDKIQNSDQDENSGYKSGLFAYDNMSKVTEDNLGDTQVINKAEVVDNAKSKNNSEDYINEEESENVVSQENSGQEQAAVVGEDNNVEDNVEVNEDKNEDKKETEGE